MTTAESTTDIGRLYDVIKDLATRQNKDIYYIIEEIENYSFGGTRYKIYQIDELKNHANQISEIAERLSKIGDRLNKVEYKAEYIEEFIDKNTFVDKIHDLDKRLSNIERGPQNADSTDKIHKLDLKLTELETTLKHLGSKMELQATKTFWYYSITILGILGGLAGLITFILKLSEKT